MPKYYLLGGENTHRRDAKEINQAAFNDAGGAPRVLIFSWARASFDNTYQKNKLINDYFRSLGARTVNTVNYSTPPREIKDKMLESDLVYLTGGVPSVLVERLQNFSINKLFETFKRVIVGRSAGALALCRDFVITYRSDSSVKIIKGLGLVDITLKAHYNPKADSALIQLSEEKDIFALPKGSAAVWEKGELSFINQAYVFRGGKKQTLN